MTGEAKARVGARILLIDDHPALRRGLVEIVTEYLLGAVCGQAGTANEAVEAMRNGRWDVAVLDLNLPGRGGLELLQALKDEQPDLRVLIYSVYAEEQFGLRAIRAGADGYLSKDRPPEDLPKAIRMILDGHQYLTPELTAKLVSRMRGAEGELHELLSDREMQVLRLVAGGTGLSEIAEMLHLSGKTITTYRTRLLEKLKLRTNADLIRYAIEHNLV